MNWRWGIDQIEEPAKLEKEREETATTKRKDKKGRRREKMWKERRAERFQVEKKIRPKERGSREIWNQKRKGNVWKNEK